MIFQNELLEIKHCNDCGNEHKSKPEPVMRSFMNVYINMMFMFIRKIIDIIKSDTPELFEVIKTKNEVIIDWMKDNELCINTIVYLLRKEEFRFFDIRFKDMIMIYDEHGYQFDLNPELEKYLIDIGFQYPIPN